MAEWRSQLRRDPLPRLLSHGDPALAYFARRDLLGERPGPIGSLWELPEPVGLVRRQRGDGSWRYPGGDPSTTPGSNYALLETYRNLRVLVGMYGFDRAHPALRAGAEYVLSCQTAEGDVRGILSNQYMPYYHGALLEVLIQAGYADDPRVVRGLEWLLSMRQADGGWIVPMQAVPSSARAREVWPGPAILPDRARPFSHLATGMVLRAFAAHPAYCRNRDALAAAALLKGRLFRADKYTDRRGPEYWLKLQYPPWWTSLLTALDSLSRMGFPAEDPDVARGLAWLVDNQEDDGLWEDGYGAGTGASRMRLWVGLAACRILRSFCLAQPLGGPADAEISST